MKNAFKRANLINGVPWYAVVQRAGWSVPNRLNLRTTFQELVSVEQTKKTVWRLNILEAEEHEGAMYAQYRIFAAWRSSQIIFDALGNSSIEMRTDILQNRTTALRPPQNHMEAYPEWRALGWRMLSLLASAYAFGLVIQMGTTWCGMFVMYLSPPTVRSLSLSISTC